MIATCPHVEPTQQKITVWQSVDAAVLTEAGVVAKLRCDELRLVCHSGIWGAHYFLQGLYIGIDFAEYFNDPAQLQIVHNDMLLSRTLRNRRDKG